MGGLERLDQVAEVEQLVAQVGAVEATALPGPPGRLAERGGAAAHAAVGAESARRRSTESRARPPSRRSPGSRRGDGAAPGRRRASARRAPAAEARPRVTRVSASSESRVTSGSASAWASERTSSRPEAKSAAIQASYRRFSGAGRTRTVTSVIAPSTPSEPSASWRSDGPGRRVRGRERAQLADRGRHRQRGDEVVEATVAGRRLAGGASGREAADRRVLERLREVPEGQPLRAQRILGLGSAQARPEGRGQRDADRPPRRAAGAGRARSPARGRRRSGSTPPTTLVPPPNGTTATPSRAQTSSSAATCSALPGITTASGAARERAAAQPDQVGIAASRRAAHALLVRREHAGGRRRSRRSRRAARAARRARPRRARPAARARPRRARRASIASPPSEQRRALLRVAPPPPLRRCRPARRVIRPAPARCRRAPRRDGCGRRPSSSASRAARTRAAPPRVVRVTSVPSSAGRSPISSRADRSTRSKGVPSICCSHA